TGNTLEKRHDSGTGVKAVLIHAPCLQGTTGYVKDLRRLTLREALGLQVAILRKQVCAFDAIPALVARLTVSLCLLVDCAHSDLLVPSFALVYVMQRMARSLSSFNPSWCRVYGLCGALSEAKWPTR